MNDNNTQQGGGPQITPIQNIPPDIYQNQGLGQQTNSLSGLSKSGLILIIINAVGALIAGIALIIYKITLPGLMAELDPMTDMMINGMLTWAIILFIAVGIVLLVLNILGLKKKTHGILMTAGILGIVLGGPLGIIGGILVLCGNSKN